MAKKTKSEADKERAEIEASLDEALVETFPASDPPAMLEPSTPPPKVRKSRKRGSAGK
jgi:hypothetical protein